MGDVYTDFLIFSLGMLLLFILAFYLYLDEKKIRKEKELNFLQTGKYETNTERSTREEREHREEQVREKVIEEEKNANFSVTGFYESDSERISRERFEERQRQKEETERIDKLEKSRLENKAYELKNKLSEELKNKLDAEEKIKLNRTKEVSDSLKRKEGTDCYECKTKVDKDGYCYC